MATIKRRYVFFADLRGSTALYETLGNAHATSVVTDVIRNLARRVPECGGQLVKTLGDGLMAVFPRAINAVTAAVQMQDDLERQPAPSDRPTPRVQLQIAISAGEVVEVGGDCFGDAVNVAARLLDHAGDSESLIGREVYDELPWEVRSRFRHLDKVHLRGRVEPAEVFLLARSKGPDTEVTHLESPSATHDALGVLLSWRGQPHRFLRDRMPVLLGRGAACGMKVEDARVSRTHARIDLMGGALQLTDLSINGTFVRFAGDDEVLSLRRGSCTLHGQGELGLGGSPNDASVATLRFSLIAHNDPPPPPFPPAAAPWQHR
ncbi:adenylate/guanylate cyclase domain-containing protein [Ideonella azotifigens]|uniref:Adenylate/guanylate cyclase domain-containing protein n=1 Tax=Ideonella azotifigens TaxID=513160 RepID=A0ABN1K3M4_9BURK|nr:adenylate/guanylate cyclase domain-containing protein [Ideonella azotifigens]